MVSRINGEGPALLKGEPGFESGALRNEAGAGNQPSPAKIFLSYRFACVTVLRLEGPPAAGLRRKQNEPSFFGVPCSAGNDLIGAGEISVIYYWI